jgi:hypothetical protein
MPTIYRIQCQTCGKGPAVSNCLAGWVATDGGKGGMILPEGYLAVKLDSGEFKSLPHPAEASTLKSLGYNWNSAERQGRLYRISFKICKKCGTFHEECQHHNGMAGCLLALIAFPVVMTAAKLVYKASWGGAVFVAYLSTIAVWGVIVAASWLRWRKPNSQLRLKSCSKCAATEFTTIQRANGKSLICPHCGSKSMHCAIAGMS